MATGLANSSSSTYSAASRIILPALYPLQERIVQAHRRFTVCCLGRRWGKTLLGIDRVIDGLSELRPVAWFSPTYKMLADAWREVKGFCADAIIEKSETEHRLVVVGGGILDMWSLEDANAGRGRKYGRIVVDEAAMTANLEDAWTQAIRPTLTDLAGDAWFLSTPKGRNYFWRLFTQGQGDDHAEWVSWQMPSSANPFLDPTEIEAARLLLPDRAFRQEYLAEFIEESGGVFRNVLESVETGRSLNEPPQANETYTMGIDLARVQDFSVITILDGSGRQVYHERFNQIAWERQIGAIVQAAQAYRARVIVDSTGVGDPIFERLRKATLNVSGYQLTNTSKESMIDSLAMALEQNRLRLMDIPAQTNELLAYEYELTPSRNVRMNAPQGLHDDCVIALALANAGLLGGGGAAILTGATKREAQNLWA